MNSTLAPVVPALAPQVASDELALNSVLAVQQLTARLTRSGAPCTFPVRATRICPRSRSVPFLKNSERYALQTTLLAESWLLAVMSFVSTGFLT
eukprot:574173-Pleurochrysis_carterae.AAC.1